MRRTAIEEPRTNSAANEVQEEEAELAVRAASAELADQVASAVRAASAEPVVPVELAVRAALAELVVPVELAVRAALAELVVPVELAVRAVLAGLADQVVVLEPARAQVAAELPRVPVVVALRTKSVTVARRCGLLAALAEEDLAAVAETTHEPAAIGAAAVWAAADIVEEAAADAVAAE
jgi:hypothetical protein